MLKCAGRFFIYTIWPLQYHLTKNISLKSREIGQAIMAIEENKEVIIERWKEYFEQ